jgi:hypothetical protein
MQSKVIGRKTPEDAAGFAKYMQDWLHPRHVGKLIESRCIGCANPTELQVAIASVMYAERKIQRGPKLKHSAVELECGTPYGTELTPDERRIIEDTVVLKLDIVTCLLAWHISRPKNKKRWREDLHILAANTDSRGCPLTARQRGNLRLHFQSVMDRIHDEINQTRRRSKSAYIPTMRDRRNKKRSEERTVLVSLLAGSDIDLTPLDISEWLHARKMRGKRVPKNNDEDAYVSVLYPSGRARRETLKELISDVVVLRQRARTAKAADAKATIQRLGQPKKMSK